MVFDSPVALPADELETPERHLGCWARASSNFEDACAATPSSPKVAATRLGARHRPHVMWAGVSDETNPQRMAASVHAQLRVPWLETRNRARRKRVQKVGRVPSPCFKLWRMTAAERRVCAAPWPQTSPFKNQANNRFPIDGTHRENVPNTTGGNFASMLSLIEVAQLNRAG